MGSFGDAEGLHARSGIGPKLTLAGRLDGLAAGRPVAFIAAAKRLELRLSGWGQAWALRRTLRTLEPTLPMLRLVKLPLVIRIGGLTLPLAPQPHPLLRLSGLRSRERP